MENILSEFEVSVAMVVADKFQEFFPDFPEIGKMDKKRILEIILSFFVLKEIIGDIHSMKERVVN